MSLDAPRSVLDTLAALAARPGPLALTGISDVLARTEWWRPAELEQHQLRRLERLLGHARATAPFYAGWPSAPAPGTLTLARWRELPILSREDVRERADELVSRAIPQAHRVVREASSSGSVGKHVTVKVDAVSDRMGDALALRDAAWHRRDPTLKAAGIRAVHVGADAPAGRHEPRWIAHPRSGPLAILDVHTPPGEQLAWLVRERAAYVATYPSNAAGLLALSEAEGVVPPGLRELGTFGEVTPPELREWCLRVWGVPLVDAYSSVELGAIALECPTGPRYHVQAEHLLVELLRPDGEPCLPGETGHVVVTALHAFAMPLLRYDLGDLAVAGEACACGRGLPVIERILGRVRNRILLPTGDWIWPRFGSNTLGGRFPLRQFRLVQRTERELVLEVAAPSRLDADTERRLREEVLRILRYPFSLALAYVDAIPRSPGGKFEDVVCELGVQPPTPALTARSAG